MRKTNPKAGHKKYAKRNPKAPHRKLRKYKWKPGPYTVSKAAKTKTPFVELPEHEEGGGGSETPVYIVNPTDLPTGDYASERLIVLWFGQTGTTFLAVWSSSLENSIETAADWLAENAPGHILSQDEFWKEYGKPALEEAGLDPDEIDWSDSAYSDAIQEAEADLTLTESGYLTSYEWGIYCDDGEGNHCGDLSNKVWRKSADIYRKQYGEMPEKPRWMRDEPEPARHRLRGKKRKNPSNKIARQLKGFLSR